MDVGGDLAREMWVDPPRSVASGGQTFLSDIAAKPRTLSWVPHPLGCGNSEVPGEPTQFTGAGGQTRRGESDIAPQV
jgi:hypothetical protein